MLDASSSEECTLNLLAHCSESNYNQNDYATECDLETVALTNRREAEPELTELKMLRFPLSVTRMDRIRPSTSEGQLRLSGLEGKLERQG